MEDEEVTIISDTLTTKPLHPGAMFAILFVVCAATATTLAAYLPDWFHNWWLGLTISSTQILGSMLGLSVNSNADIMTVNGFAMRIITQCTALHYVIILSTAILLYTRHSFTYRITGLLVSILIIVIANAIRLIITGVIGSISWAAFVIVHDYLWIAAFSLLILGIWIVWAERRLTLTSETIMRSSKVIFACTAVYGGLLLAMPLFGRLIALITSTVFKTLISDPHAGIMFTDKWMLYKYADGTFSANFTMDLMVVALYIGLILSGGNYGKANIKRSVTGLVIILCICVAVIAGGGALAVTQGTNVAIVFLWAAHGMLLQLTLLWWMLRGSREANGFF